MAEQSIVLLQNRDHLLPLDKAGLHRIAVLGPLADRIITNNYNGKVGEAITPLQGIKNAVGSAVEILHARGCEVVEGRQAAESDPAGDLARAADLAHQADVALLFVGTNDQVEQEGRDRKTLGLTGRQEELVRAVLAANPRTVVIEMSAGPLTVPWLKENVPAILQAWWPGEEGGSAIARILFGEVNPGGRLPHTVYASEQQVPPNTEYEITKGFTYMYVRGEPLFPFGHGLSYTEFQYDHLEITPKQTTPAGALRVSIEVTNRGSRAGDEVVQLYVHEMQPAVKRPIRELRGFQRIHLDPGERRAVTFALPAEKLAYFDEAKNAFVVRPGAFQISIGSSSADIRASSEITVGE